MFARPYRNLGAGHRRGLAAPQPGAQRDSIAVDGAAIRLDANDTASLGEDAGDAGILEQARAVAAGALDQRGAEIRRADPAVIR